MIHTKSTKKKKGARESHWEGLSKGSQGFMCTGAKILGSNGNLPLIKHVKTFKLGSTDILARRYVGLMSAFAARR